MKVWIVGQITDYPVWEFQGVFDSKEKAIKACKTESYFTAPATMNEELANYSLKWKGVEYPFRAEEVKG